MEKLVALLVVACVLWLLYEWYEHNVIQYSTTHVEFCLLPTESDVRICLISDLHNNKKKFSGIMKKLKAFSPEYIFLAGDMVDKHNMDNSNAVEFINALAKYVQVYYSMGNHEEFLRSYYPKEWQKYLNNLDKSVVLLDNEGAFLNKEQSLFVSGLSLPEIYYKKGKLCSDETQLPKLSVPKKSFHILLAHHPEYAPYYTRYQANLILSGHLHGGLLRLPFVGGVVSPRLRLPFYDSGVTKLSENQKMFVSRGLGSHTIPLRFFNHAEINFLILKEHRS